jgi:phage recombination protein Bet
MKHTITGFVTAAPIRYGQDKGQLAVHFSMYKPSPEYDPDRVVIWSAHEHEAPRHVPPHLHHPRSLQQGGQGKVDRFCAWCGRHRFYRRGSRAARFQVNPGETMNALAKTETTALATMSEPELMKVLQTSLYPGAAPESIKMVLGYCKAAGLDPMQKPVHIVPMWDGKARQMRDVVMPGVNLYRTQAARSGECAGVTEPEFGPDMTEDIGGQKITYPQWCRVTVARRLPTGEIVNFTAREFWKENYAVKGGQEKSIAPNAMWTKRPYGQIAKCAEAQALRKAFPEIASQPTADEMEGKALHQEDQQPAAKPQPEAPKELVDAAEAAAAKGVSTYSDWWQKTGKENRVLLAASHEERKRKAAQVDAQRTVEEPAAPMSAEHQEFVAAMGDDE